MTPPKLPGNAPITAKQSRDDVIPVSNTDTHTHTGGHGRVPEVGQPVLPGLDVEVRDDLELSVLHSLTSSEVQSGLNSVNSELTAVFNPPGSPSETSDHSGRTTASSEEAR